MDTLSERPNCEITIDASVETKRTLRPIRSLLRGLECLMVLNTRDGVTVTEIARATRLPRTTAHRILETLCEGGYVVRDGADERYRATILVRTLSDGFGDESWVREVAKPELESLGRCVLYPVAIATASGMALVVRESTDRESPLAIERMPPGTRLNLATTAAGRLHLALMSHAQRRAMLDILIRAGGRLDPALRSRAEFDALLDRIGQQGFCIHHAPPSREASIAVPIQGADGPAGYLVMRYIASAVSGKEAAASYLPQLAAAARRISAGLANTSPSMLARIDA